MVVEARVWYAESLYCNLDPGDLVEELPLHRPVAGSETSSSQVFCRRLAAARARRILSRRQFLVKLRTRFRHGPLDLLGRNRTFCQSLIAFFPRFSDRFRLCERRHLGGAVVFVDCSAVECHWDIRQQRNEGCIQTIDWLRAKAPVAFVECRIDVVPEGIQ